MLCDVKMCFLWVNESWEWNFERRRELWSWVSVLFKDLLDMINRFPLSKNTKTGGSGRLTKMEDIHEANQLLDKRSNEGRGTKLKAFEKTWNNEAPLKCKIHAWRTLRKIIPTVAELLRRGSLPINVQPRCTLCKADPEEVVHCLFECPVAQEVWKWSLELMGF